MGNTIPSMMGRGVPVILFFNQLFCYHLLSSKSTVRGIFSLGNWKSREQEVGWEEEREQEPKTGM